MAEHIKGIKAATENDGGAIQQVPIRAFIVDMYTFEVCWTYSLRGVLGRIYQYFKANRVE
jgi:hypothetical protein